MKCKIFTTPMCPKCNALKESMKEANIKFEVVDATNPEGLDQARKYQVSSVPTVLFLDEKGDVVSTAHNFEEVKRVVDNKSLTDVK